ncbi:MAG: nucleotidyltransferase family protein [Candidatus Omnitrophica bacterium]|nr:nucleotidyltransferase family protein [Candidatus Omnitrophota bacterium]
MALVRRFDGEFPAGDVPMYTDLETFCVTTTTSLREVVTQMDQNRLGIALVLDTEGRLVGTVSDGDVRRAVLANIDFQQPVTTLLASKAGTRFARPITAPIGADSHTYLNLLKQHRILYVPLIDEANRVAGLVTLDEFVSEKTLPLQAVVMAGGRGTRLHPLTEDLPKPMLRVGDRPVLEIIIQQLRDAGITQVKVTTHHKPEKITEHFGDGSHLGVNLSYVEEDRPLGTVGGLGLLEAPKETTLVINGDILTDMNFRAMLVYHKEYEADLTVAVRHYEAKVPYGVVECEGSRVCRISEKPALGFFVNAGIYLLEPSVYTHIPSGQPFDMTDLIQRLLEKGRPVASFPVREYWLDIGQRQDYEQAQAQVQQWQATR